MPEFIKKITDQITGFWNKLSTKNKIQIVAAVVVIVAALVALTVILNRPTMVKYASGISPEKMNEMKVILDDNKIPYEIADNATTLYVDAKRKQDVTMLTEQLGVISDAEMTWEEALNNSLSTTSTEKQVKIQLAFEEELNKKIEALDVIKNAYVKLNIAQKDTSIFDETIPSSASVILETIGNLNQDQIMGIVSFLEKSVSNLDPSRISIMTTNGKLLYNGTNEDLSGNISNRLDYEAKRERDVEAAIRNVLLAGGEYDDATVFVDLAIDFDEMSKVTEEPIGIGGTNAGGVVSNYESKSEGSNNDASGRPGTDSNTTDYMVEDSSTSESKSSVKETQYQLGKIVTSEVKNIGGVKYDQSSVTVSLNKYVKYDQALLEKQGVLDDITWEEFKAQNEARTKAEVDDDVVELIKNATQINRVAVIAWNVPVFIDKEVTKTPISNYIPVIIIVVLILLLAFAVYKGTTPVEVTEVEPELSVEELLASTKEKQELEEIAFDGKDELRTKIEKFVQDNPEAVALLLRNWLNEDWE